MNDVLEQFKTHVSMLEGCCMSRHEAELLRGAVEVVAWEETIPDERSGGSVVRLGNGTFAVMEESEDYTGHG